MKPIIGVIARVEKSKIGNDIFYMNDEIARAIIKSGGIPILITPTTIDTYYGKTYSNTRRMNEEEKVDLYDSLSLCDGFICQGGDEFYDYDLQVIHYAYERDLPLLGICLGMQTMGYLFGGTIVKIETGIEHNNGAEPYSHFVTLKKESRLFEIINQDHFPVNSRHHDQLVEPQLSVTSYSDDGVIESIEDTSKQFFIGVEWHPESMYEYDPLSRKLFDVFLENCRKQEDNEC